MGFNNLIARASKPNIIILLLCVVLFERSSVAMSYLSQALVWAAHWSERTEDKAREKVPYVAAQLKSGANVAVAALSNGANKVAVKSGQLGAQMAQPVTNALLDRVDSSANNIIQHMDVIQNNIMQNVDASINQLVANADVRINKAFDHMLPKAALITGALAVTGITAWYASKFIWHQIDKNYAKPVLFTETSEQSVYQKLRSLVVKPVTRRRQVIIAQKEKQLLLSGIIKSTKIIKTKIKAGDPHARYRNVLLWGPPGTGKTMFAKQLAHDSGMDFRMMSGPDVSKLKLNDALAALDEVFNFAHKSKNGLILFIDEADSFLADRSSLAIDDPVRKLVNKFLNACPKASNKFMLVFATNNKDVFDDAVKDRIALSIKMDLPNHVERQGILKLYRNNYLLDAFYNSADFIASAITCLSDDKVKQMASQLDGLSGRALENVISDIRNETDLTEAGVVTPEIIKMVTKRAVVKHREFHEKPNTNPAVPVVLSPAAIELLAN